jgi:hypothetical protein
VGVSETLRGYDLWLTAEPDAAPDPVEGEYVVTFTLSLDVYLPADQGQASWARERAADARELAAAVTRILKLHGDELPVQVTCFETTDLKVTDA